MTYSRPINLRRAQEFAASPGGFAVLLALGIGILLFGVGFRPDTLPFRPGAVFSDAVISHWPDALFLRRALQGGDFPLWRSLLMSGQPFATNPLNKVWYPPQWLVYLLPPAPHLNLLIWVHLVFAGIGMRAFGRRLGFSTGVAGMMGIAYGLTPRLWAAVGGGHLDILYAAAWFPWTMWAVHYTILGKSGHSIWRGGAILALTCGMAFVGDIRLSAFIFGTAGVFGVWLLFGLRKQNLETAVPSPAAKSDSGNGIKRRSAITVITVAIVLALGLTAVEWLPLAEVAPSLTRNGLTAEDAAIFSLKPLQLIGVVLPRQPGSHETETDAGLVITITAVIGSSVLFRSERRAFFLWVGLVVFAALYALGDQGFLWPILVRLVPPLLWLRVPPRIWIVVILGLIVLAGYGAQALATRKLPRRSVLYPIWRPDLLISVICLLVIVDLAWTDITRVEGRPQSEWLDAYQPLAQALIDSGVTRVYSPSYSLPQQVAAYWNIPDFGGIDPFQLKGYVSAFEAATGVQAKGYSVTLPAFNAVQTAADYNTANQTAKIDAVLLAQWDVSHVVSAFPIDNPDLKLLTQVNSVYVYKNLRLSSTINLKWNGPNRLSAQNTGTQTINVEAWSAGWQLASPASTDGAGIIVPPGQTIEARYTSPGFDAALLISGLSLLVAAACILFRPTYRAE